MMMMMQDPGLNLAIFFCIWAARPHKKKILPFSAYKLTLPLFLKQRAKWVQGGVPPTKQAFFFSCWRSAGKFRTVLLLLMINEAMAKEKLNVKMGGS